MKKPQNSSKANKSSEHGRREFVSMSFLAGSALLLSTENHGYAQSNQENDLAIVRDVSAGDSVAIYANLLDEVRRLVLRSDAERIFASKVLATNWLDMATFQAG